MFKANRLRISLGVAAILSAILLYHAVSSAEEHHPVVKSKKGNLVVELCDGKTSVEVEGVKEGQSLPPARAQQVADQLMVAQAASNHQTSKWTARDRANWAREEKRVIAEGDALWHSSTALGNTTGIACAMCHPNAANTHPETYPKFQTQLKRVATLRDMINWCIENPVKGKKLAMDDERMIALEAYVTSMRKGVALDPGRH